LHEKVFVIKYLTQKKIVSGMKNIFRTITSLQKCHPIGGIFVGFHFR
jgi:hypothetical protein